MKTIFKIRNMVSVSSIVFLALFLAACGGDGDGGDGTTTPTTYSISGQVTSNGTGLSGVSITLSGDSSDTTTTDSAGNYSFSGLSNGSYMVTPSLTGYTFDPTSRNVTISGQNETGIDFSASEADTTAPSAPEGLFGVIADLEGTSLDMLLMWVPNNESDVKGYNVYRMIGASDYQNLNSDLVVEQEGPIGLILYFADTTFNEASTELHSYYVTAVDNSENESPASSTVSCIPAEIDLEETVENLSPTDGSTGVSVTPTFSWSSEEGASSYCIMLQKGGAQGPMVWIFRAPQTSFRYGTTTGYTYIGADEQLLNNTYYRWQINAINSSNVAFAWNEAYFTTEP